MPSYRYALLPTCLLASRRPPRLPLRSCHLEVLQDAGGAGHTLDLALAAATAYGGALSRALRVDPRRRGAVASSKGTLSK